MKAQPAEPVIDAEQQLDGFIAKFDAKDQKLIRALRKAMRKRLPTAHELIWDNYNFFVIAYGPTERPSEALLSIAARAGAMGLSFLHGATLSDPAKRLLGSGNQNRYIRLPSVDVLEEPEVEALIVAAIAQLKVPLPAKGRGKLIIRSVSAKQRPRSKPSL